MVKVSICVPAYKNPVGVERLLESVKVQSFTDYEVVVTDDSQDGSVEEVVRRAEVPGMVYVRNAVRKGATGNWNEAVRHASGEYIKIMHHDDWFTDRDCLARFVEMLEEHPEADLAFCGSRQVMLDGVGNRMGEEFDRAISDEHLKMISEDWRDLYIGDYIGAPSATIYRKGAPEYEEKLTWIVDVEFYMRLLQKNPRFVVSKEPLVTFGISIADVLHANLFFQLHRRRMGIIVFFIFSMQTIGCEVYIFINIIHAWLIERNIAHMRVDPVYRRHQAHRRYCKRGNLRHKLRHVRAV